jgi:type IV secretory pathway TrbD component
VNAASHDRSDEIEGFALPLRTSLTRPIQMGGTPRSFAILNATLGAAIGLVSGRSRLGGAA